MGNTLASDQHIGALIDRHCNDLGLIVRPIINMCVLSPPLIVTEEQIDQIFDILDEGITRASV